MAAPRKTKSESDNKVIQLVENKKRDSRPMTNPEAREQQLVNLAVDLAEKQLKDGTASPSVINHFLKVASKREYLERQILEKQATLIENKSKNITKGQDDENASKAALDALRNYKSGSQ